MPSAGCWRDEFPPTGRAMPTLLAATATMTVEQCTQLAWSRGYALAALQYSNECYASEWLAICSIRLTATTSSV
jgi:hypothetical protein